MTKLVKFFPTTEEVQDIVLWVDDIEAQVKEMGLEETMGEILDRVIDGDLKCSGYVHVIDDNKELATQMAYVLDANYQKEMELMKDANVAKEMVTEAIEAELKKGIVDPTVDADKAAEARAFLDANGPAVANAKKAPVTKEETTEEEVEVKETKKVTGRRRVQGAKPTVAKKEETVVENQTKEEEVETVEETKTVGRRRVSSGKKDSARNVKAGTPKKKLGRGSSMKGEFKKHEGNWYTNAGLYPVLDRFEQIIEDMADAELGIEQIVLVEPEEINRYAKRADIDVVIQLKSNGVVMEFPIKEASSNSKSDLTSPSIGWVEGKNGMYPAFGFYRPNGIVLDMTCSCGNKLTVSSTNVYCGKCRTRHADADVHVEHVLDINGDIQEWVFQTVPNLFVPRDTLALVMAVAQYDAGLPMDGLVDEE
jgi:hypothetical protein